MYACSSEWPAGGLAGGISYEKPVHGEGPCLQ